MAAKTTHKRNCAIRVRWSAAERKAVKEQAKAADLSTSDFIRHAALGAPIKVIKLERLHPADLNQIKRLGNLMNQIARAFHRGRHIKGTYDHLHRVLDETQALVRNQLSKWRE